MTHHDPTDGPTLDSSALSDGATIREAPGSRIGPYRLLQVIGEGGFGTVFMAEQQEPVSRRVALKIIKLGMDTRQVIARFEAERQALALMDHPHIARVLDAGATETGRPYFVMELVKGDPITLFCDRANLPVRARLELFAQVCHAVQHAHQKGIIHRDIKPGNILVTVQDGAPFARVIDFGIAKATGSKLTEKTLFTEHRQLIGTPEYMSPEQAHGGLDIDTRTDVYSLGVLLYELLTGSTPFQGTDLRSAAYAEVQRIIREVDPPRPSTRLSKETASIASIASHRGTHPARLGTLVRGELDWIVMKALEKDRRRRYETANGLAADVQRYLSGEPVSAAPPSSAYRLAKLLRRHRGAVVAAGLIVAALVLGIVGFAWQAREAGRERDRAVAAESLATARAEELTKVTEFQAKMLSGVSAPAAGEKLMQSIRTRFAAALLKGGVAEEEHPARTEAFSRDLGWVNATDTAAELIDLTILRPAADAAGAEFKDQPLVQARLKATLAESYRTLGLFRQALPLQEAAMEIRLRELGDEHPDTLLAMSNVGSLADALAQPGRAVSLYEQVYTTRRRVLGEDHADTLMAMGNLGNAYRAQSRFDEAEPLLTGALAGLRRVLGNEQRRTLISMNTVGMLYAMQGRLDKAEPYWREAYETGRKALGDDEPDVFVWINNLAGLLQGMGKMDEAEALFIESLERNRRVRGEEHPNTIRAVNRLGAHYQRRGDLARAEPLLRDALERSTRVQGREHPNAVSDMSDLANCLIQKGDFDAAAALLNEAVEISGRTRGPGHPDTLTIRAQIGRLYMNTGDYARAEAIYRETVPLTIRTQGPEHPETLQQQNTLANILMQAGKFDEARDLLLDTLEKSRRISGPTHDVTLNVLSTLAVLAERRDDFAEAEWRMRELADLYAAASGPDHAMTHTVRANHAAALVSLDRAAEAEPIAAASVAGLEKTLGPSHPRTAHARVAWGRALTALARYDDAQTQLLEADRVYTAAKNVTALRKAQCAQALVALYEALDTAEPGKGFDEKAAPWRDKASGK